VPRRFIGDLMHFARQVPTVPVERRMHLGAVAAGRRQAVPRPSWCSLFAKAYGIVCAANPELRRSYLPFPWPHLYEHPITVASIAIERRVGEEYAVLPAHLRCPEQRSLQELDARLRAFKQGPIERIGSFRRALKVSSLPLPLRRLVWWGGLNLSGRERARTFGTFGVSVYGSLGATSLHPLSPLTTLLNTGVLAEDGSLDVRLVYDHRTLDGATLARALADLEQVLHGDILNELHSMRALDAA
jgi:hypothetical protein